MIKMWLNSLNRCAILCVMCALSVCLAPCYAQSVLWSDGNEYVLSTIDQEVFDLPGEPGELTFSAKRTTLGLGSLYVDVWNSGAWQRMGQFSLGTSYQNYGPLLLPRTATRLRFCTEFGATLSKYITDIMVTKARYLDVDVPALFTLSNNEQQLTVRYADMGGDVVATCSDTHFQIVSPNDGCFHNFPDGSGTITVRFLPDTLGDYYAQLILTDGEYVTRIPLHGRYALADNEQEIIRNQRLHMLDVGDTFILDVIPSSGLPVSVCVLRNDGVFSIRTDFLLSLPPGAGDFLSTRVCSPHSF